MNAATSTWTPIVFAIAVLIGLVMCVVARRPTPSYPYGDCRDGDVTIEHDAWLDRDMQYRNVTINDATLHTGSFRARACETLTLNNGSVMP